jgi:hypothetical protein
MDTPGRGLAGTRWLAVDDLLGVVIAVLLAAAGASG